jgi:hypothetical protein
MILQSHHFVVFVVFAFAPRVAEIQQNVDIVFWCFCPAHREAKVRHGSTVTSYCAGMCESVSQLYMCQTYAYSACFIIENYPEAAQVV